MRRPAAGEEYVPAEDTFFLADYIEGMSGDAALDIGSGSGYLTRMLEERFSLAVGTDIDFAVLANQTYRASNTVCCHGASGLGVKFDLIVCNLPYLDTDEISDVATDGGHGGLEVARDILDTVPACLRPGGTLLLVTSSLSDCAGLVLYCNTLGMDAEVVARKRLFFEELILVRARLSSQEPSGGL